jgi:glycogen operon protein
MLSQGVPMICGGDEIGRTQGGNNNAYCQDNPISWFDWKLGDRRQALLEFTRRLVAFRLSQPVLRRRRFFQGRTIRGSDVKDLTWFRPDGEEMTDVDWRDARARALALRLAGDAIEESDEYGNRIVGDTLLVLLNARTEPLSFRLPRTVNRARGGWKVLLDTASGWLDDGPVVDGGARLVVSDRSLVVLKRSLNGVEGSESAG